MFESNTVILKLEDYLNLLQEIKNLELTIGEQRKEIEGNVFNKQTLLKTLFKKSRMEMGYDTKEEQTDTGFHLQERRYGSYYGFSEEARNVLFAFGFTHEDLHKYILEQWARFEVRQMKEKEQIEIEEDEQIENEENENENNF